MLVRPLAAADLEPALDLFEAVVNEGRWLTTEPPMNRREVRAGWKELAATGEGILLVAVEEDGTIAGVLALVGRENPEVGMAVRADRRRRGVGDALLGAAVERARTAGCRRVILDVFPHNEAGIGLYRKHGFEVRGVQAGAVRRRSGERWDAIRMVRELER